MSIYTNISTLLKIWGHKTNPKEHQGYRKFGPCIAQKDHMYAERGPRVTYGNSTEQNFNLEPIPGPLQYFICM